MHCIDHPDSNRVYFGNTQNNGQHARIRKHALFTPRQSSAFHTCPRFGTAPHMGLPRHLYALHGSPATFPCPTQHALPSLNPLPASGHRMLRHSRLCSQLRSQCSVHTRVRFGRVSASGGAGRASVAGGAGNACWSAGDTNALRTGAGSEGL